MTDIRIIYFVIIFGVILIPVFAQFGSCDYYDTLEYNKKAAVFSTNYPKFYSPNTACRWTAISPVGTQIVLSCQDVYMPESPRCMRDRIEVSRNGRSDLQDAHRYCGVGNFTETSNGNRMTISLRAGPFSRGGRVKCSIFVKNENCKCGQRKTKRIVGGMETLVNEFPEYAGIVDVQVSRTVFCGSTIISEIHALTAAHCLIGRERAGIRLLVGDHDISIGTDTKFSQLYAISHIVIHPLYVSQTGQNDIAVLRTTNSITFNEGVSPVCLPFNYRLETFAGSTVEAAGWGTTEFGGPRSNTLQKVELDVISNAVCASQADNITAMQVCTQTPGKDTCQSDSGGALFYTNPSNKLLYQIGVISRGVACATRKPGVNLRVSSYLDWIVANTPGVIFCRK